MAHINHQHVAAFECLPRIMSTKVRILLGVPLPAPNSNSYRSGGSIRWAKEALF